jgi:hypothetical protein
MSFESVELYDHKAMRLIIDNWETLPLDPLTREPWEANGRSYTPITILKEYYRKSKPGREFATFKTTYVTARGNDRGRQFAKGGLSMQGMPRTVRHTVARDLYYDIDMVNAHPVILLQYCERNQFPCPILKSYVDDRDSLLKSMISLNGIERDQAKKVVLSLMNGGKRDYDMLKAKPDWLAAFKNEIQEVHSFMLNQPEHKSIVKCVVSKKGDAYKNLGGSVCNHVLCAIEDRLLMSCVEFLTTRNVSVENVVLVFDGFMLPRGLCTVDEAFLEDMSFHVAESTGYKVSILTKDMDDIIDLSNAVMKYEGRDISLAVDDNEASGIFIEMTKDIVKQSGNRIFVLTEDKVWTDDPLICKKVLLNACLQANIMKLDDRDIPKPYSNNVCGAEAIIKATMSKLPNDANFAARLWESSIGKVFYADGVYDFRTNTFREELEDDITTIRLTRNFPVRDEAKMAEVRAKVLGTIFGSDEDVQCFLAHIARGMAGEYEDKNWVVCQGERNCGKGVCTHLNEKAWEAYTVTLNSDSFMMERMGGGDEAKKLSWLLDCEYARLIFTNEITVDKGDKHRKLNGNLIKGKLSSGGDSVKARQNYKNEVEFKIQGRLFLFCNDLPPITPADTMETMHMFTCRSQFVEKVPENALPFVKLRDDNIKKYCCMPDVIDAYTWLVIDAYTSKAVKPSKTVKEETANYRQEGGDEWGVMKEYFEITRNSDDRIPSSAVANFVKEKELNMSQQKARQRLQMMGAVYKDQLRIGGKVCRGFSGVRIVYEDEEDTE